MGPRDLWLRPCPRPQKTFPDRKNQASYAGFAQVMPVSEKNLIITCSLLKFCFIQN